jgi:hypothetical protein
MLRQNHTPCCLPCPNGTANNSQTRWGHKRTGAPLHNRCGQKTPEPTSEPTPSLHGTAPASTSNISSDQCREIITLPAKYAYSHTSLPCAESFTLDASAQDSEHDKDFDPDMLPVEGTSTGWYTISCAMMQLTFILKTRVAY